MQGITKRPSAVEVVFAGGAVSANLPAMEAIPLSKQQPSVDPMNAPSDARTSMAALLQAAALYSSKADIQGWIMTAAFLPFGLILAVWSAYPAASGTALPIVDTLVGLSIAVTGMVGSVAMGARCLRLQEQARFWRQAASEIEEHLGLGLGIFKREQALMSGEAVVVGGERMRLSSLERPARISAFHVYYGMFTIVFAFLLIANFLRFGRVI